MPTALSSLSYNILGPEGTNAALTSSRTRRIYYLTTFPSAVSVNLSNKNIVT